MDGVQVVQGPDLEETAELVGGASLAADGLAEGARPAAVAVHVGRPVGLLPPPRATALVVVVFSVDILFLGVAGSLSLKRHEVVHRHWCYVEGWSIWWNERGVHDSWIGCFYLFGRMDKM